MSTSKETLLPGGKKQLEFLLSKTELKSKSAIVLGSSSELVAEKIFRKTDIPVNLLVEDGDSLISSMIKLEGSEGVKLKLMDFRRTDFQDDTFDIVYAQASISDSRREEIIREIARISSKEAIFCVGEITANTTELPAYVSDALNNSGIDPLLRDEVEDYYGKRGWIVKDKLDLKETIPVYYKNLMEKLEYNIKYFSENDLKQQKKDIKKLKHESKVFTKLGGSKYIGYIVLLLKKGKDEEG